MTSSGNFAYIRSLLRICGLSLQKEDTFRYKIYSWLVLSFHVYPFFQFLGAHKYLDNGLEAFEFGAFVSCLILILVKALVVYHNRIALGNLLNKLENGIFLPNRARGGEFEETELKKCAKITYWQAFIYFHLVSCIVTFALLDSGISRLRSDDYHDWKFEYGKVTMINTTYSPNYELAVMYQNVTWFLMGWTFAVCDLLTATVLANIACQLKMCQNAIKRITANSYLRMMKVTNGRTDLKLHNVDVSTVSWKYIKPVLKEAVEYHLGIIEMCGEIENTFHLLVLFIVLSAIVLTASLLYRLTVVHFGGSLTFLFEIFLISYWGNEVSIESQNLVSACYEADFVGSDRRLQRGLFIIMERSKRPIVFTAGKFSPLTLGTFLWIARTTYSYLMILRRMNN